MTVDYTAAIVTFRRPESLAEALGCLVRQTEPPALIVVVDNDPEQSARGVVENGAARGRVAVMYIAAESNLGPAGGWARAAAVASQHPDRGEWLVTFDDDDPISAPDLMAVHLANATRHAAAGQVAAVGLRGATLQMGRARLRPGPPDEPAHVDYLASNGAPAYSWAAVDAVGFFDPSLWFGFEDLDLGLRFRDAGWTLVAHPLPHLHRVAPTSTSRVPWREYYKTRAMVAIGHRRRAIHFTAVFVARSTVLGGLALAWSERKPRLALARMQGAYDGWRGRLGRRRYTPTENPAKRITA